MNNFFNMYIGKHFFDQDSDLSYKKPTADYLKNKSKEEICRCPLCSSDKFIMVGKFSIDEMVDVWVKRINFNPIADVYRHCMLEKNN